MLRFSPAGYTACICFAIPGGTVDIHIQPDPEPPTWLGRFSRRRVPGAVRSGEDGPDKPRWYVPDVPARQIEEAALALHGRQGARRLAHRRIREDRLRLAEYGRTWSLYRLTVTLRRDGHPPLTETVGGLSAHDIPLAGGMALAERILAGLLDRPTGPEPSGS